jgi:hypothetical protein
MTAQVDGYYTPLICHEGSNSAWYTILMITPELGRGWIMVSNAYRESLQDGQSAVLPALAALDDHWIGRAPLMA